MRLFAIGLAFALLFACSQFPRTAVISQRSDTMTEFFVLPQGNDQWSGRKAAAAASDGPFASLARAQLAVREELRAKPGASISVIVADGRYELPETLHFASEDSANSSAKVTYKAAPGAAPVISGGRAITGWTRSEGNKWTCQLPDVAAGKWWFRDLFADNIRQPRSRFPKKGYTDHMPWIRRDNWHYPDAKGFLNVKDYTEGDVWSITPDGAFPGGDLKGQNTELVVMQLWELDRARVDSADSATLKVSHPVGVVGQWWGELAKNRMVYLEHALAFVQEPGEWYLDKASGTLTWMGRPGEDPNQKKFFAPVLTQLISIEGTQEKPVRNLHFEGLRFEGANWDIPAFGYNEVQAGFHKDNATGGTFPLPFAIDCSWAIGCSFDRCKLLHTGASGISLGVGCRDSAITRSHFEDVGGIVISAGHYTLSKKDPNSPTAKLTIADNVIHDCGTVHPSCPAIWQAFAPQSVIEHNLLYNLPYTGISAGWCWGVTETNQRDLTIQYNHIHNYMRVMSDGGGIYTLGDQPGTVVRNNLLHDSLNGNGLYTDQGSSHILLENNVVYRVYESAWHHNWDGYSCVFRNNILASAEKQYIMRGQHPVERDTRKAFNAENNIIWIDRGNTLLASNFLDKLYAFDNNLYWDTRGWTMDFCGRTLAQWQAEGQDAHSQIADPLFRDPVAGDFALLPNSPALNMGFKAIDLSEVGPRE